MGYRILGMGNDRDYRKQVGINYHPINTLVFVNPFCTVSAIHLDGFRSICSFIKCPLVIESRRFSF